MLKKVLVIGSGPIVIGQAAEFDYSGSQACRVLREENIQVVLVNNNPATIMTDKALADVVYSEPLTVEYLEKIIDKEKPDALLAGMGGQTALNLSLELHDKGILDKYGVKLIGTNVSSIETSENREMFKNKMLEIGQPCLESQIAKTIDQAREIAETIGYPIVVRPAFTLGGTGGGFCYNNDDLEKIVKAGLQMSMTSEVLIEKSIKGWKEVEYEMMRDHDGNTIVVCNMENFDPVGIHTGDSIVIAPSQTLSDKEYQMLRRASIDIVSALNIVGGCNVQLALDPNSSQYYVIEVNPRVSRSSALASKATGYPIAKVATKIALGYSLDQITNDVTKKTKACFEPVLDYCVLKIPKWPFNKFKDADRKLGTQMMATGEVMAIGNNFESALLKGIRSLEINQDGLYRESIRSYSLKELMKLVGEGTDERIFYLAELIRRQVSIKMLNKETAIDMFFLEKMYKLIEAEESIRNRKLDFVDADKIKTLKRVGFSDKHISDLLLDSNQNDVRDKRLNNKIVNSYRMVDTCAGEFEAYSPYYYSTYDAYTEVKESCNKKVIIVGSGPISIGQGVEFDYCSVHGVYAVQRLGYDAVLINNNPETVSTDFDIADRLYFEPITFEDVMNVIDIEKPEGVILQYGGQTSIKLAEMLSDHGIKILGTDYHGVHLAEDRESFNKLMASLDIDQPQGGVVYDMKDLEAILTGLSFPLLCRPSYVIGGEGMKIVQNKNELKAYLETLCLEKGVLLDEYLEGIELEVDCITDGQDILIPGIMEHLELSGVHSGDSTSVYPPQSFSEGELEEIQVLTKKICRGLKAVGMVNIQFIYAGGKFYIIEVNPRASRTVPFLSKVTGINMIDLSTRLMLGEKLSDIEVTKKDHGLVALKIPVFSMEKIQGIDTVLSPEMKSTGEMMSIDRSLNGALYKSQKGLGYATDVKNVFISVSDPSKDKLKDIVTVLNKLDVNIYATKGTHDFLEDNHVSSNIVERLNKTGDILDKIQSHFFDIIINIPSKGFDSKRDGFMMRTVASKARVQCFTSIEAAQHYMNALTSDYKEEIFDICAL
ncbi:carbamoyl-phosphate synthase (glutamine-hydrolyzing) large subunit [Acidaminobacter sp. JC074]|uniref:carbamoyl-phosphate synthase (glutamine-hydrolyzing) large subunit n=1 Tax=Acidaminobacter sp. JC074 TaxID=2530199 RepID=UPI001F10A4A8|nr:carbamoyl-phosphate synthase (glutamine-hydrolyzing) large subunit [Acidaminobacter sp. JC074]MCH4890346.1 carbamoyl-phosphate synthase (glutamine-hydrolyzing) large subunit [Acidaminobacter sp. JC074]